MQVIDEHVLNEISLYKDDKLRDYQEDSKQKIYKLWKETNSVLLQMPTGTGKTRIFVSIINDLFKYGENHFDKRSDYFKILILAHRKELIDQITDEIRNVFHLRCSKIVADERTSPIWSEPICVASVQTLNRRLYSDKWFNHSFNFIIIDEAHHVKGDSYRRILRTFKNAKVLGATATPYRLNGDGLCSEFDEIIISPSIKDFIDAGRLSNYDYYSIKNTSNFYVNLDNLPLDSYGDYQIDKLWDYCKPSKIQAEVVATYLKYANGKKGIVYTIKKEHNHQLCEEFQKCGISAYGIDSDTKASEREDIIRKFKLGKITVLCNVNIFTEGFDCPDVEFVQLVRPTKSLGLYLQQVGRGLRISQFKQKVIFLDNVGLYHRFGLPSSNRDWAKYFNGKREIGYGKRIGPLFTIGKRDPDLTEGNEEVILIQTTGMNDIKQKAEDEYLSSYEGVLKPIINSIFQTNIIVCENHIRRFDKEKNVSFDADIIEDILSPCPTITAKTDDLDTVLLRIENEFKPIVVNGKIDYEKYEGWEDYKITAIDKVRILFKKQLENEQSSNIEKLDRFTANQLRVYFDKYYGKDHNMSKKIHRYCLSYGFDDTWSVMKTSYIMRKNLRVEEREEWISNIGFVRTTVEHFE